VGGGVQSGVRDDLDRPAELEATRRIEGSHGEYIVNCADYTSANQRNEWYLNSKLVKEFNGSFNVPAPPQFERGVPAAFKLASTLAGR
jgi:hypothetical protein